MIKIYTLVYTSTKEVIKIDIAKVFTNGGSQAVRHPKNCRFEDGEVFVNKIGNIVLLIPKADRRHSMLESLDLFTIRGRCHTRIWRYTP